MFVACSHVPIPSVVIKPSAAEIALQELVTKEKAKRVELEEKLKNAETVFKQNFDANLSLGAASVMAGLDTLIADPSKTKFTTAAIPAFEVAVQALPPPSLTDYKKTVETQRKLLSDQQKEIEAGKKEIEEQKGLAVASKEAQKKAQEEKAAIQAEQTKAAQEASAEKSRLSAQLAEQKNETIRASETARALEAAEAARKVKDAEDKKDLQRLLIYILMGAGAIAGVLAYFLKSPGSLFNPTLGFVAGSAIALAIAISFIPGWIIAVVSGLVVLVGIYGFIRPYIDFKDVAHVAVGGIQEHKAEITKATFKKTIGKKLKSWTGGDPKLESKIDKVTKDLNLT